MKIPRILFSALVVWLSANAFAQAAQQNRSPDELIEEMRKKAEFEALKSRYAAAVVPQKTNSASPLTALQASVKGTFWRNPEWVTQLGLSPDQQKKMDDVFLQYRLKLIDLTASLEKEELILEPLWGAMRPAENQAKILTQIDRIADARAELEKANSRMLLGILDVLTPEQWAKLPMQQKKGYTVFSKPTK